MRKWKPYWTAFRIRALLETQYRGAALGGIITQVFFGLVYICLYQALYAGGDPAGLKDTITYVWMQQMFFRLLLSAEGDLTEQIMSGGIAYTLCRPVDQYAYWLCRSLASKAVGSAMRAAPMLLVQLLLPAEYRMSLPESPLAMAQFAFGLVLGALALGEIENICAVINMKTLDGRGVSAMIRLLMMILSGNVIPLTLFPDSVQALIRYQPFAQALDAPIRMYLHAQSAGEWLTSTGVQMMWIAALLALGRAMWRRQLNNMTVQGG